MEITVKENLSGATIVREDGKFFVLGPQNPETQTAWKSEADIQEYAAKASSNPYVWQTPSEPEPVNTVISPTAFKRRFFPEERVAIATVRAKRTSSDPEEVQAALLLDVFFEDLDDIRLTEMDLTDPTVETGLGFLVHLGIITQERADTLGAP